MTATTELTTVESPLIKTDRLGRIHISREHRERLLDAFEQSGMSGVKFAEHCGVKYTTFASWIQKRRREKNQYPANVSSPPDSLLDSLAEVDLAEPATEKITVDLPGGSSIKVKRPGQAKLAAALINNLKTLTHA